jgi:hypothetical protein
MGVFPAGFKVFTYFCLLRRRINVANELDLFEELRHDAHRNNAAVCIYRHYGLE